jgi:hypothetical protein
MQAAQTGTATPFRGFQQFHEQANQSRDPMEVVLQAIEHLPSPEHFMQANKLAKAEMIDPTQAAGAKVRATGQAAAMNAQAVASAAQTAASGFGRGFGNLAQNRRQAAAIAAQQGDQADDRAYAEGEWDRRQAAQQASTLAAEERKAQAEAAKEAQEQAARDKRAENIYKTLRRGISPKAAEPHIEWLLEHGYPVGGSGSPMRMGPPAAPIPPAPVTPTVAPEPLGPETAIAGPMPGQTDEAAEIPYDAALDGPPAGYMAVADDGGDGIDWGSYLGGGDSEELSKGEEEVDEKFAEQYVEWGASGGAATAIARLSDLQGALTQLDTRDDLTGSMGYLPDAARLALGYQDSLSVQQDVERVIQNSMKQILGAQFTEKEGVRLLQRTYDPRLPEKVIAARVRKLADALRQAAEMKEEASRYWEKNGTLKGFKIRSIEQIQNEFLRSAESLGQYGKQQGGAAPDGTRVQMQDGSVQVKRGGGWVNE